MYSQYLKQTRYWDKRSAPKLYSPIHISDVIDFHQKPFHAFWVHLTFTVMIIDIYKGTWVRENYQYFNTSLTSTDTMEVSSFGHWQVAGGRKRDIINNHLFEFLYIHSNEWFSFLFVFSSIPDGDLQLLARLHMALGGRRPRQTTLVAFFLLFWESSDMFCNPQWTADNDC